jgi:uncharacterized protein
MSRLYGEQHRQLQDSFGTRNLANLTEQAICRTELDDFSKQFIQAQDMFFLTTIDHQGRPTVSYKGGTPGFVQVISENTLVFPSYDGNGMYLSMGNITQNPQVGLLFISFEKPYRLRIQGKATVSTDDPMLAYYKEAELIVRVVISEIWTNCPRYIHRYQKIEQSRYVPDESQETPLAGWKQIDLVQNVISEQEATRANELGIIGIEEWMNKVIIGDPTA